MTELVIPEVTLQELFVALVRSPKRVKTLAALVRAQAPPSEAQDFASQLPEFQIEELTKYLNGELTDPDRAQVLEEFILTYCPELGLAEAPKSSNDMIKFQVPSEPTAKSTVSKIMQSTYGRAAAILFALAVAMGAGFEGGLTAVKHAIADAGLDRPLRFGPNHMPLFAQGNDRIACAFEVNKSFFRRVRIRYGNEESIVLYEAVGKRASQEKGWQAIAHESNQLKSKYLNQYLEVTVEVEPFEELKDDPQLRAFFSSEHTSFRRKFFVNDFGVTQDPAERQLVGEVDKILADPDEKHKSRYLVTCRGYPQPGNPNPTVSLIIEPSTGGTCFVADQVRLPPSGLFAVRCFLNVNQLDQQKYLLYLVVANRPNAEDISPPPNGVREFDKSIDWNTLGFNRSDFKIKVNNGKDDFLVP